MLEFGICRRLPISVLVSGIPSILLDLGLSEDFGIAQVYREGGEGELISSKCVGFIFLKSRFIILFSNQEYVAEPNQPSLTVVSLHLCPNRIKFF